MGYFTRIKSCEKVFVLFDRQIKKKNEYAVARYYIHIQMLLFNSPI